MTKNHNITIGGVTISIQKNTPNFDDQIPLAYRAFSGGAKTDITIHTHYGVAGPSHGEKVFESLPIWALYRKNGASILKIFHSLPGLERTLVLPQLLKDADLYFPDPSGRFLHPFFGPTIELLMIHYLAKHNSVILHACGIALAGRGILFVGESGAGKSTVANMWRQMDGVEILSDDRIILRKKNGHYWMYGTPWHGDAKIGSPQGAKVERIFFIRHAQNNSIKDVNRAQAVLEYLKASFPPYWDVHGMEIAMDFFNDLAASVSSQVLAFKPDKGVIGFINDLL